MNRDEKTYGRIRRKYETWVENEAIRPERERHRRSDRYEPPSQGNNDMSRMVTSAIGIGTGVLLLLLAAAAFNAAGHWAGFGRDGAQTGYLLAGFFLLIAGIGGIVATWNHNFRVLTRPPQPH